jgi:hypothetical protein
VARTFHIGLYRSRQFEEYNREKQGDEKAPKTILKRVKFLFFKKERGGGGWTFE